MATGEKPAKDLWDKLDVLGKLGSGLVLAFLQFHDEKNRELAEGLQVQLKNQGFSAPGTELVSKDYPNEVRFFHKEDSELAQKVARVTENFLQGKGSPRTFKIQDLSKSSFSAKAQKGQVEIWINLDRS